MKKKVYISTVVMFIIMISSTTTIAKYVFNETLDAARFNTKGNYYLITYTETSNKNEMVEKLNKGENHDIDGKVLKKWIMDKRKTIETIKIEDNSGDILDCSYLFGGSDEIKVCLYLTKIDLSNFNTENVTDMKFMFYGCARLFNVSILGLKTDKVEDMSYMFGSCSSIKMLDLSSFDKTNLKDASYMFSNCMSLEEIDVTEKKWNISNTLTKGMFNGCKTSTVKFIK